MTSDFETLTSSKNWFVSARYDLLCALYTLLGRVEWALYREQIPIDVYKTLAERFTAEHFDADAICDLTVRAGMSYIILTTLHHAGEALKSTLQVI